MRPVSRRRLHFMVLCVLVLAPDWLGSRAPSAQSAGYRLITMTSGVGAGGPAADVSDSGIVVGYRLSTGGGYQWTQATGLTPIGDATVQARFPCYSYFPPHLAVNATGTVVGRGGQANCGNAPIGAGAWSAASGYIFIGGGDLSAGASGVNASGTIVGLYRGNSQVPFIWRSQTGLQILPGFNNSGGSEAFDINDSEVVVGRAGGGTCGAGTSAFTWTEAVGVVCLPRVFLNATHEAFAISNNGHVAGRFSAAGTATAGGVFMWTAANGTVDLNAPPGSPVFIDVNDAGDVVVTIVPPLGGTSIPYLYRSGTWININTLLPAGAEVILKSVTGINSAGWMVGDAAPVTNPTAGGGIGWLLIPPAPTTTSVNPTPSPSSFGAMVTFTATVQSGGAPVPTGTVTFSDGGTVLAGPMGVNASGQASFSTAGLAVGAHTVTVAFSGAPGFDASSGSVTHTVNAAPPTSQNDGYSTSFETTLDIPAAGVLSNDSNGGAAMTAALQTNVAHGTLSLGSDGGFTYSPNTGFVGTDSFAYLASNSVGPGNTATVTIAVANPTTVQPPTALYVSAIRGNEVTFRWNLPAIGPAPEQFVLSGGLLPGQVLATIPTGGADPIFKVTAPDGAYYVRIQSFAAGGTSAPSNEVRLFVNTPTPPSAPANLLGLVNGSTMGLAWRHTYGGAAASSMLLDVTGTTNTTLPIGPADSFTFGPVPAGTYTLTVRGVNAGGIGPPSPPVTLTFPGACSGAPLPPARFLAYRAGTTIFAVWDPAASGPAPSGFVLHVTGSFVGDIPTAARSVSGAVGPGSYGLSVSATNACGSSAPTSVQTVSVP